MGVSRALAAGSDRRTFVYNFHALRFSRSSFSRSAARPLTTLVSRRGKSGAKSESVSAREMLLLFMYFDKIPPRAQFARQFGAKHSALLE